MACAASTEPPADGAPGPGHAPARFDPDQPHRLHPKVALRPEPFGALAYHYGNRRLTFVRSPEVVDLLRELHSHPSVTEALAASPIDPARRPSVLAALARLCASEMICAC